MSAPEPKMRRQAVREWSCPNHPEGPPTLPAGGYDAEGYTLDEAYPDEFVQALARLCSLRKRDGARVARTLGVCCLGCEWKTVGYRMVEVSPYEDMMLAMKGPLAAGFSSYSVLLDELSRPRPDGELVRIPLIRGDE